MATRARNGSSRQRDGLADAALRALSPDEDESPRPRTGPGSRGGRGGSPSRNTTGRSAQKSGSAGNSRKPSAKGTQRGPASRNTGQRNAAKRNAKGRSAKGSSAKGRSARGRSAPGRSRDPVVILIGWIGRTPPAAWGGVAGSLGFLVRAVGRGARDLDPHHRRDGVGLLTLGVAIVLAASLWGRMGNAAGRAIRTVLDA